MTLLAEDSMRKIGVGVGVERGGGNVDRFPNGLDMEREEEGRLERSGVRFGGERVAPWEEFGRWRSGVEGAVRR